LKKLLLKTEKPSCQLIPEFFFQISCSGCFWFGREFFSYFPSMKRPSLINSPQALKREMDLLETLGDIEVAMRALKENLSLDENPLDHHYRTLGVDILPVERSDPTFTLVEQYLSLTQGPTHAREYKLELLDVFTTIKQTPFEDVGNRMLLWHGSRMSNFVGILSQGLRIAPPEAPVTGYMFGESVRFVSRASFNSSSKQQKAISSGIGHCKGGVRKERTFFHDLS
jgi:poly [ADP-ribose] polymerase 2/3/4